MLCMVLLLYDKLSLNHFKDVYDVIFFMAPFKGGACSAYSWNPGCKIDPGSAVGFLSVFPKIRHSYTYTLFFCEIFCLGTTVRDSRERFSYKNNLLAERANNP